MITKFTKKDILMARKYWGELTPIELIEFWKHYTTGNGAGMYMSVKRDTSFFDYLVHSAAESEYERVHDI